MTHDDGSYWFGVRGVPPHASAWFVGAESVASIARSTILVSWRVEKYSATSISKNATMPITIWPMDDST